MWRFFEQIHKPRLIVIVMLEFGEERFEGWEFYVFVTSFSSPKDDLLVFIIVSPSDIIFLSIVSLMQGYFKLL